MRGLLAFKFVKAATLTRIRFAFIASTLSIESEGNIWGETKTLSPRCTRYSWRDLPTSPLLPHSVCSNLRPFHALITESPVEGRRADDQLRIQG